MNQIVLTINGHKVKATTDQEITEVWKTEMIEWVTRREQVLQLEHTKIRQTTLNNKSIWTEHEAQLRG